MESVGHYGRALWHRVEGGAGLAREVVYNGLERSVNSINSAAQSVESAGNRLLPRLHISGSLGRRLDSGVHAAAEFSRGFVHSGAETPGNAALQFAEHVTGGPLPRLTITGAPTENSIPSTVGSVSGTVADMYLLATVGDALLPGSDLASQTVRLGATGAFYEGMLQPSDPASQTFLRDRMNNAIVGGTTWATIGLASGGLESTGIFAPAAERGFLSSVGFGAASSLPAGLVHAEARALVNGRLASRDEVLRDGATFTLFGAVSGAGNYVMNRLMSNMRIGGLRRALTGETASGEGNFKIYKKVGTVHAERIDEPFQWTRSNGEVMTAEAGDWRITGPDGKISSIKPDIFAQTYAQVVPGVFEKVTPTTAMQLRTATPVQTLEGPVTGQPGDYLVVGAKGERYIVSRATFEATYRLFTR